MHTLVIDIDAPNNIVKDYIRLALYLTQVINYQTEKQPILYNTIRQSSSNQYRFVETLNELSWLPELIINSKELFDIDELSTKVCAILPKLSENNTEMNQNIIDVPDPKYLTPSNCLTILNYLQTNMHEHIEPMLKNTTEPFASITFKHAFHNNWSIYSPTTLAPIKTLTFSHNKIGKCHQNEVTGKTIDRQEAIRLGFVPNFTANDWFNMIENNTEPSIINSILWQLIKQSSIIEFNKYNVLTDNITNIIEHLFNLLNGNITMWLTDNLITHQDIIRTKQALHIYN